MSVGTGVMAVAIGGGLGCFGRDEQDEEIPSTSCYKRANCSAQT